MRFRFAPELAAMTAIIALSGGQHADAAKRVPPKPKASVANYCKTAKEWLAFENATLAVGPYDEPWVLTTGKFLSDLYASSPKAIKKATGTFGIYLIGSRLSLASVSKITSPDEIWVLRETGADVQIADAIDARNSVGAYTTKICKVDVLAPFRAVAAGFE